MQADETPAGVSRLDTTSIEMLGAYFVTAKIHLSRTPYMVGAMILTLVGCQANPERPDASGYGDPPHQYEQPAKDAVAALPYFNSHSDTWHFVNVGTPYRAYSNGMPVFNNKLVWNGYLVDVVVSVKNHIGYSNQDTFHVQFDGDKVHGVVGDLRRESLNRF